MSTYIPIIGFALCAAAFILLFAVVLRPRRSAVPLKRRRPFGDDTKSALSNLTESTVSILDRTVGGGPFNRSRLDDAGLRMPPSNFLVFVLAGSAVLGLVGLLLSGPALGILFAIVSPVAARTLLTLLADRRRANFDQQLGDNLLLISGGLRAGHSVAAALDSAAKEAPVPSSEEFARIGNEVTIGRDLEAALTDTAVRMKSVDFAWIAQAIQINREVGGNLAEVLDHVGETIRERGEIKAQVKSLSAEGRLSALILMALPFGIALMLMVVNPTYLGVLTTHILGWVMLAVGSVMLIIGGLWMRKIIDIKF